jgi:carbamoylphosphate synthase large subunit
MLKKSGSNSEVLTIHFDIAAVFRKECPDAVLPPLGGQTALNAALQVTETGFAE